MTDFITVNNNSINIEEALGLSVLQNDAQFAEMTVGAMLLQQYAEKIGLSNSHEELQWAIDEVRYDRGLESAEKATKWLNDRNISVNTLRNYINTVLLRKKVKDSITSEQIKLHFIEHERQYDEAEIYSIRVDTKELAEELYMQVSEEDENFHLLAMEYSQDEVSKLAAGYIGKLKRNQMTAEIESAIFKSDDGRIIPPIKTEKGYNLFMIHKIYPASLEKEQENIRLLLFNKRMNKLREQAKIEYDILRAK
ncbi:peptidylprolyl isomerase [Candidatus Uabimicrobium sp. HlEnr_7]|uniref:peptidylprolyl isomerase n=1 Tax=Candidatus Uabimicrobium helgolandensis TaxID=3095367 RepID=UPI003558D16A